MAKEIEIGINDVKINTPTATERISQSGYWYQSNISCGGDNFDQQITSASSITSDCRGNCQQTVGGTNGRTVEADIFCCGNPYQFEGSYIRQANEELAELAALLLQPPDNRRSLPPATITFPKASNVVSNMTSSYAMENPPPTPSIKSWKDIPSYLSKMAKWQKDANTSNIAHRATQAALTEIERVAIQTRENLKNVSSNLKHKFTGKNAAGSPSTEDKLESAEPNIEYSTVVNSIDYDRYIPISKEI